ncbi:MAG: hypothetical protein ABIK91_09945 [Pseudomonadota bacterium]
MQTRLRDRVFSSPWRNFRTSDTTKLLPRITPYSIVSTTCLSILQWVRLFDETLALQEVFRHRLGILLLP